ncbi:MAG TPA: TRAM domain-containing protein [Anaerolineales bacterium]
MPDTLHDLTLSGFAYGGDALGRISRTGPHPPAGSERDVDSGKSERVVFVPFGIPGERVRVRLVEERRGFARAELLEVLEPSPQRIAPRCRHFGVCGGCHYQHIPYELQLKAKTDILRDQFRRIGRIDDPPVHEAVPSPNPWNYRNQVQFHLTAEGRLGYVAASTSPPSRSSSPDLSILPITECHLPEPAINRLWPELEFEPGTDIDRVTLRRGAGDELMVMLESARPDLPALDVEAGISVVHTFDDHLVVVAGDDHIMMQVLGRNFRVSAPSFFQVNTAMAEQMVRHILENLPARRSPVSTVLDAYCGAGLFSAFLAPLCDRLIGIESSPAACDDFAFNLDEFDNVELYEDAAGNVLASLDVQPDVILVDPPRLGLDPPALDGILRLQPRTVAYVSCDPSTLARDARRLIDGGYHLRSSIPFDLFPQTYHIESISWFER